MPYESEGGERERMILTSHWMGRNPGKPYRGNTDGLDIMGQWSVGLRRSKKSVKANQSRAQLLFPIPYSLGELSCPLACLLCFSPSQLLLQSFALDFIWMQSKRVKKSQEMGGCGLGNAEC